MVTTKPCYLSCFLIITIAIETQGRIRNGYEHQVQSARQELMYLTSLLNSGTVYTSEQIKRLKKHITFRMDIIAYYELTANTLSHFRIVAAQLYDEMDTIKDAAGRPVDVYVKVVSSRRLPPNVRATANLPLDHEIGGYYSHYGVNTASIKVTAGRKILSSLAHELGHLRYQIPNAAVYKEYYKNNYTDFTVRCGQRGHNRTDESGLNALKFEKLFYKSYRIYRQSAKQERITRRLDKLNRTARASGPMLYRYN